MQDTATAATPCLLDVLLVAAIREAQGDGCSLAEFCDRSAAAWFAVDRSTIDGDRIAAAAVRVVEADRDGNLAALLAAVNGLAAALADSALLPT